MKFDDVEKGPNLGQFIVVGAVRMAILVGYACGSSKLMKLVDSMSSKHVSLHGCTNSALTCTAYTVSKCKLRVL